MTTTIQSVNSIGTAAQFTFAAAGDSYIILPGVTVGSTVQTAINFAGLANLTLDIGGSLVSATQIAVGGAGSSVSIGSGGRFVSTETNSGNGGFFLGAQNSQFDNAGEIFTARTIGIISGGQNSVVNSGRITAASGVFLGLNGGAGDSLVNSGQITASRRDDDIRNTRFNNAVFTEGANTQITNQEGGILTAISSEGAGVRLGLGANGSTVLNAGLIEATTWFGVDFSALDVLETGSLTNFGTIRGGAGAFTGNTTTDIVFNRGLMVGDVFLNSGADRFDGIGGTVQGTVFGGLGDDTYRVSDPLAQVFEAVGGGTADRIDATINFSLVAVGEVENLILLGNAVVGTGNGLANTIIGSQGDNLLYGLAGNDTLYGGNGGGNDRLIGGIGDDTCRGGEGDDQLFGQIGNDRLDGNDGDDVLTGGLGNDYLVGGADQDRLVGGAGADAMFGGSERDTFVFVDRADSGTTSMSRDAIRDYVRGVDIIDFSAVDANSVLAGNQAFVFTSGGAFTNVAGQLIFQVSGTNGLLLADLDGNGTADFSVFLTAALSIIQNDLVL